MGFLLGHQCPNVLHIWDKMCLTFGHENILVVESMLLFKESRLSCTESLVQHGELKFRDNMNISSLFGMITVHFLLKDIYCSCNAGISYSLSSLAPVLLVDPPTSSSWLVSWRSRWGNIAFYASSLKHLTMKKGTLFTDSDWKAPLIKGMIQTASLL